MEVLIRLTADAVDHEWVQLFLAVLPLSGEVGDGLHLAVEQVVQQRQGHFLCRATVGADVQHVCWRHRTAHTHLRVVLITQPRSCRIVLYRRRRKINCNYRNIFPNVQFSQVDK